MPSACGSRIRPMGRPRDLDGEHGLRRNRFAVRFASMRRSLPARKLRWKFLSKARMPRPSNRRSPLFCNQCGGRIADGSVFCNLCGAKQGVVAPAQVAPGVPPAPGYPGQAPGVPGGTPMGQPYNPNAPVQQARPPSMPQSMKCSSCGGPLSPGSGLALVVCEYCGAVTTMGSGGAAEVIQKHYMLENKLSNEAALE